MRKKNGNGKVNLTKLVWSIVTSLESIKRKCGKGISMQNVRTALKRFENTNF